MKKSTILYLSIFAINTSWANNCVLTDHMLDNGGAFDYDDYLYADSSQFELRKEKHSGNAYLCGQGYCEVGTKIRLNGAALGGFTGRPDSVYECINTSTSGRTSYQWRIFSVQSTPCVVNSPLTAQEVKDVINGGKLYKVGDGYCTSISEQVKQTNFWDTVNNFFDNGTNFVIKKIDAGIEIAKNNTERIRLLAQGVVEINGQRVAMWKHTKDGLVEIYNIKTNAVLGGLQILADGTVKIVDSHNKKVAVIAQETGESYRATLEFFNNIGDNIAKVLIGGLNTIREISSDIRDVKVTAINGGIELSCNYMDNKTQRIQIRADKTVKILDIAGRTLDGIYKTTKDGVVTIYDSTTKTVLGGLQILTDGTVKIVDSHNKKVAVIAQEAGESYRATLQFFSNISNDFNSTIQTAIQEVGATARVQIHESQETIRNMFDNFTDYSVSVVNAGKEYLITSKKENTKRIRLIGKGIVEVNGQVLSTAQAMWQVASDNTAKIIIKGMDTVYGGFKLIGKGAIEVFKGVNEAYITTIKSGTEAYKATLQFFGNSISDFNATAQEAIKAASSAINLTIQETGKTVRTAMNNANDFAKHFTSEIIGGIKAYQINSSKLNELERRIAQCTTQEQVADIITKALNDAELNEKQIAQVRQEINNYAIKNNQRLDIIESRILNLEQDVIYLKQQNEQLAIKIESLGAQHRNLAIQIRTKVNARQVVELIQLHTQEFSAGQKEQLMRILDEYTAKLSSGQRAEVEAMINSTAAQLNSRIDLEANRRAAENKILSNMSILNSFAASADVSVWKDADGKFNGVRLASDMTAGVVLGTVGGVVSGVVIKKKQVEKGFDALHCTVGGQAIADYEDEFVVGIQ